MVDAGLRYLVKRPGGALTGIVDLIWLDLRADAPPTVDRIMPRGGVDLLFELGEASASVVHDVSLGSPGAVVAGPRTASFVLDTPAGSRTLGVSLRPGSASALLRSAVHETRNRHVALSEFWGSGADGLRERLISIDDAGARIATVEAELLTRLRNCVRFPHPAARRAAAHLAASPQRTTVATLGRSLGLSERRVQQIFRDDVGLTPKQHGRLERFRHAACDIERGARLGWAAFAVERGFYDQSHLCNEFRAHAGVTPGQYVDLKGPHLNHLRIAG